jgi:predicted nucleic acid-binding protein
MLTVYVETTIPSYLAAFPSRDLVAAANQQITHEWWRTAGQRFELVVSDSVLLEISAGDAIMAKKRMELVAGLRVLRSDENVQKLFHLYQKRLSMPKRAENDLLHLASAVRYSVDYLVTWNCAHIANGQVIKRLIAVNKAEGLPTPLIVTPQELQYS